MFVNVYDFMEYILPCHKRMLDVDERHIKFNRDLMDLWILLHLQYIYQQCHITNPLLPYFF